MAEPEPTQPQSRPPDPAPARGRRGAARLRRRTARVFDPRTEEWRAAGLGAEIDRAEARRALRDALILILLLAAVLVLFGMRHDLFPGAGKVVRYVTAALLVVIGWGLARTLARAVAPVLIRRMDPATAGSVGFLFRLLAIFVVVLVSLGIAGVKPETLLVGGAFTAVILGLAAQQTLGNVIAGATLLGARPFRVSDRVRIRGSGIDAEGTVASLGLFYTVLVSGGNRILVPNSVVMSVSVMPVREPPPVRVTASFARGSVTPAALQVELAERVRVPLVRAPEIELEEVRTGGLPSFVITATPDNPEDGSRLAEDVLAAIRKLGGEGDTDPYGEPARPESERPG